MLSTDDILGIGSAEEFDRAAMEVFRRQARECPPYREYLAAVGIAPEIITSANEIPFLPIELFKTHRVYCGAGEPETVFTSSSTGGGGESRHYIASTADYERVYTRGFELFYGDPRGWSIYALLPSYLEREGSSLVRMVDGLIRQGREDGRGGGFYLYDHDRLMADIKADSTAGGTADTKADTTADSGKKILLGVSYALLDLAERGEKLPAGTIVMETGGMKGRREEMSKTRMHAVLQKAFGVGGIHSEYGMAELMSQAYSTGGGADGNLGSLGDVNSADGTGGVSGTEAAIFRTPPWMRVAVRDLNDPFDVRRDGRGGLNIIDLANLSSCAFIQTQDIGTVAPDGSFTVDGRVARSDIRGCNLLVQ